MADHHKRLRSVRQQRLEPENRIDVEVVGRFVEQQQIRIADEGAGDSEPRLPAARQRAGPG